jgi:3-methyladenine DNA glycosylase AlkD
MDEKEFFIRKAIGWALRQYSYTNMKSVFDFVHAHEDKLSPLSKREAMKGYNRINKN